MEKEHYGVSTFDAIRIAHIKKNHDETEAYISQRDQIKLMYICPSERNLRVK
jgi:hypothetical protein